MRLEVEPPFRLLATVRLLQRRPRNPLDSWEEGAWMRLLDRPGGLLAIEVRQAARDALELRFPGRRPAEREARAVAALVRRTLGLDVDLAPFRRAARRDPRIVRLMVGVRPPRFTSLFEAIVGVVPFQQLSLDAGVTLFARVIERYGVSEEVGSSRLYAAPRPEAIAETPFDELRSLGLSGAKVRALQSAAAAILEGRIGDEAIERLPTPEARALLRTLPGIGPWSADLILLRGFGRLDAFPPGDVGVARGLTEFLGAPPSPELLDAFAPQQGMLYYVALLSKLQARGMLTS